jgi:competence protein ComEA
MRETEFPTSKLLIVLGLSLLVCSCVKLSHQVTATDIAAIPPPISTKTDSSRLNINTASARDLEALPGVGKILADRILAHRAQYGPFRRAEHLMMVRGFSDHKFRAIRERITVE